MMILHGPLQLSEDCDYEKYFNRLITPQPELAGDVKRAKECTRDDFDFSVDIPTAEDTCFMLKLGKQATLTLAPFVQEMVAGRMISPSGYWMYPACGGYMGWHTNSDAPYERIYMVYSETGESWFKYKDPVTGEIVSVQDNKGWNLYRFKTPKDELFWHCVYAECNRYSFGFRII
tara:strand:- start:10693 stop:11217 length:525 start_codon:yes stop_codon:yes gene_type:complete